VSDQPKNNYAVGYGKPPKQHQFKKGHSGNARGRPKKSRNVRTLLIETLNQRVQVRENGKVKIIPLRDAYIKKLTEKAMNGTMREMLTFLKEIERIAPEMLGNETTAMAVEVQFVMPDGERMDQDEFLKRSEGLEK